MDNMGIGYILALIVGYILGVINTDKGDRN